MKLIRRNETEPQAAATSAAPWRILVVDDEPDVHTVTQMSLRDFRYAGRGLELLSAKSAEAAREILVAERDIALALIDVVMESDSAGLKLVEFIRAQLGNRMIRLIIRTGQPGVAPEREVIDNYDIDGYKDKTELTAQKLYTTVRSALKAYHDLRVIDANRRGLGLILQATPDLYLHDIEEMEAFFRGVLTQVAALCNLEGVMVASLDGYVATLGESAGVRACIGGFCGDAGLALAEARHRQWEQTFAAGIQQTILPDNVILTPLLVAGQPVGYIYLEGIEHLDPGDRDLVRVMANQVSAALRNLTLQDDLRQANAQALSMLAEASEYKDEETGAHLQRMRLGTRTLSLAVGLDEETANRYGEAAILHDVGKMGVPDAILQKPAKLTPDEFAQIKRHTLIGESILGRSRWLALAKDCAVSHHERWDGSGYPYGLQGEAIPLIGRIVAIMDVFDALTHKRPYKDEWPLERVVAEIAQGAGHQFDPHLAEAFLALHRQGQLESLL